VLETPRCEVIGLDVGDADTDTFLTRSGAASLACSSRSPTLTRDSRRRSWRSAGHRSAVKSPSDSALPRVLAEGNRALRTGRPAVSLPGFVLGVMRRLCWVVTLLRTSALSVVFAREDEGERPNGQVGRPHKSRSVASNSARLRDRASVTVKLQAEVPHAGQLERDTRLQTPHRTAAAERSQDRDPAAQHVQATFGRWNQAPVVVAND
jgi:hypothetical protein